MTDELIEANLLVTVFGGSGFIGRHVVRALAQRGWRVRVAVRRPDLAFHLQPLGDVGQIHAVQANLRYPDSVAHALRDAAAAVNLVGILQQSRAQRFDAIQHLGAQTVAKAVRDAGFDTFVQMSAIGADPAGSSLYARTKAFGEAAVREVLPGAIIMRPSVVFGPEDQFFNWFAAMARHAVEALNRSLRKIIKTRGSFPNDEAALKLLYLAIKNAGLRWRRWVEWTAAMGQLAIQFGDRFPGSAR